MSTPMKFFPKKEKCRVFSQVKIISQDLTTEGLFTKVSREKNKLRKLGTETTKPLIQQKVGYEKAVLVERQMS